MNNSTIYRKDNNTSTSIEALDKFYSVEKSVPYVKKVSTDISSSKNVRLLQKNISEDVNSRLTNSAERFSSISITCNFSINLHGLNSLPFSLGFSELLQSAVHKKNLENYERNRNISKTKIEEYFALKPFTRGQLRERYAAYVKSTQDVFNILDCGNVRSFVDAYDGAVDLLAECDRDIISNAVEIAREKHISTDNIEATQSWEKNWDILIKAVSCALKIEPHKKMSLLLSLCDPRNNLSRLVKLALIDAIVDLDLDTELIMVMLQIFISERESDNFVRNYASEQAEECL